jgi:hypothetical protein
VIVVRKTGERTMVRDWCCRDATKRNSYSLIDNRGDTSVRCIHISVGCLINDLIEGSKLNDREARKVHVFPLNCFSLTLTVVFSLT